MNYEDRKKRTYKYLAYAIGYGRAEPQPTPPVTYDGAELGRAILGTMILGKE